MGLYNLCNPAINAAIFYIILIIIILITKPQFLYDHENNKFKEFGCNYNQTYFPLVLFGIGASILFYYIFVVISNINCVSRSRVKYLLKYT